MTIGGRKSPLRDFGGKFKEHSSCSRRQETTEWARRIRETAGGGETLEKGKLEWGGCCGRLGKRRIYNLASLGESHMLPSETQNLGGGPLTDITIPKSLELHYLHCCFRHS